MGLKAGSLKRLKQACGSTGGAGWSARCLLRNVSGSLVCFPLFKQLLVSAALLMSVALLVSARAVSAGAIFHVLASLIISTRNKQKFGSF